jgi:hypothetical protein
MVSRKRNRIFAIAENATSFRSDRFCLGFRIQHNREGHEFYSCRTGSLKIRGFSR